MAVALGSSAGPQPGVDTQIAPTCPPGVGAAQVGSILGGRVAVRQRDREYWCSAGCEAT